jgi:hypothetical protein
MTDNLFGVEVPGGSFNQSGGITLGTRFTTAVSGNATHGKWYFPGTGQPGAVQVRIGIHRNSDQVLLGSVLFSASPTLSAWNTVAFTTPIALTAGVDYTISVWVPEIYVATTGYSWPKVSGNLTSHNPAGYFSAGGSIQYPNGIFGTPSYFADIIFDDGSGTTTPVTSTLTAKWLSYTSVTSALTAKWLSYTSVVSSFTGKWLSYTSVSSELTAKWNSYTSVASSLTAKWRSYVSVSSSLTGKFAVQAASSVTSQLRARWRVFSDSAPVTPEVVSPYIQIQRGLTTSFINMDPTTASLVPRTRTKTAAGGFTETDGTARDAQTFKMVLLAYDQRPTVTLAGVERVIDYHLVGPHDMAIAVGDYWTDAEGTRYDVVGFSEGWGFETKAFISRHVPREARP